MPTDDTDTAPSATQGPLPFLQSVWSVLKHPATSLVFGLIVSWYFFKAGERAVQPTYTMSNVFTIVSPESPNEHLSILWDQVRVQNVQSVKVAFWNSGVQYIGSQDILQGDPIHISASGVGKLFKILSVRVLKSSRPQIRLKCQVEPDSSGRDSVRIEWEGDEVLERMDGGLIEIIYTDDLLNPYPEFKVDARIRGALSGFKRIVWQDATERMSLFWKTLLTGLWLLLLYAMSQSLVSSIRGRKLYETIRAVAVICLLLFVGFRGFSVALTDTPNWLVL